ncbi:MAG TPA: metallopeptidase TldD-related protein, partial [Nitrospirota bacterium]
KTTRRSNQLFLIKEEPESIRRVDTVKYFVAVHQLRKEGDKSVLGESSFVFIEGEDIGPKVDLAVEMAKGVANQPWTLPGPGQKYLPCEIKDTTIVLNPDKMIQKIKEEIVGAVERLGDVRLSSAEVFADHTQYELVNSLGLTAKADDTDMLFDFVLMTGEGEREVESSGFKTVRYYKDLKVAETLKEYAQFARDSLSAKLPEHGKFDVVFAGEALDTLFSTFISHSGGSSAYQGWSRFAEGKPVIADPEGELLTMTSNPQMPGGMKSGPFDGNGLATRHVEVVKDNIFKKRTLDKKYADYLGGEPAGAFANIEVGAGKDTTEKLLTEGTYLLLRFSTFEPNPVTGNFSGEIRTGYRIEGGKRVPVKGGSVSGDIQDAFRRAYFSSDKETRSSYHGPRAIKLMGLDLAGEE